MKLSLLSRSSRAALMATLTRILIVLVQLSLAATLLHKAHDEFERRSVPCTAKVGTGAEDATAARGDPRWLALIRAPPPPLLAASRPGPNRTRGGESSSRSRSLRRTPEATAWL
jgi:hypothetical protein